MAESNEERFQAALATAVETVASSAEARPSEGDLKEARKKAEALVKDPELVAGMKDLQNLALSIGLPAARTALRHLIDAGNGSVAAKKAMHALVDQLSPITERGSIKIDFYNNEEKKADAVYLMLDECERDHNLGDEIGKIRPYVSDQKWPQVLREFSMLVGIGRSVFAKFVAENEHLVAEIQKHLPDGDKGANMQALAVDKNNTTLFVLDRLPRRVGIFVRRA